MISNVCVQCITILMVCFRFFFFFKQKTAYEMRISDWSSDVCSSDLRVLAEREAARRALAADLDADIADHVMHHEQWIRARDPLQPLAEQRVRLDTARYSAGSATLIAIADAFGDHDDATHAVLDRESMAGARAPRTRAERRIGEESAGRGQQL